MRDKKFREIVMYVLVLILIYFAISSLNGSTVERVPEIDTTEFVSMLQSGTVKEVQQQGADIYIKNDDGEKYRTYLPNMMQSEIYDLYMKEGVESGELRLSGVQIMDNSWRRDVFTTVLMISGFALIWYFLMRSMQGGNKNTMNFGKSNAKIQDKNQNMKITFSDVAGLKEEKEELSEIVDFLKNPKKYTDVGARIPTGVLLVGPPGTGKTYLSRAVAGEAGVPFFSISGSDFVEMFVGVGASRVRDLFEQAKKNAPAIVFIDEIDAVGRRRGAGLGGGHDEREQTLNQLLVEMDGFSKNEGIIVMAATNRVDILDPALLRPGRFDRTIYVGVPDVKGREEILKVHTRKKPLCEDVDLNKIAKRTAGFTPADLENMMNEAALLTARDNRSEITMEDINEASIKVQAGPAKKSKIVSDRDKKITAVHEAGHAIVSRLLPNSDPVHMITIIPRGMAGGFTAYTPENDDDFITKKYLEDHIVSLLGGRVAESIMLDDISTGASNDIERATKIAHSMVTTYGMSEKLGAIKYGHDENNVFVGRDIGTGRGYSEDVAKSIDNEVHEIIDRAYKKAEDIINSNKDALNRVSDALLEYETLSGKEFENIFQGKNIDGSEISENILEDDENSLTEQ